MPIETAKTSFGLSIVTIKKIILEQQKVTESFQSEMNEGDSAEAYRKLVIKPIIEGIVASGKGLITLPSIRRTLIDDHNIKLS